MIIYKCAYNFDNDDDYDDNDDDDNYFYLILMVVMKMFITFHIKIFILPLNYFAYEILCLILLQYIYNRKDFDVN